MDHRILVTGGCMTFVVAVILAAAASEQLPGDPIVGRELAEGWCVKLRQPR